MFTVLEMYDFDPRTKILKNSSPTVDCQLSSRHYINGNIYTQVGPDLKMDDALNMTLLTPELKSDNITTEDFESLSTIYGEEKMNNLINVVLQRVVRKDAGQIWIGNILVRQLEMVILKWLLSLS